MDSSHTYKLEVYTQLLNTTRVYRQLLNTRVYRQLLNSRVYRQLLRTSVYTPPLAKVKCLSISFIPWSVQAPPQYPALYRQLPVLTMRCTGSSLV